MSDDTKKYNALLKINNPKEPGTLIIQKEWKQIIAAKTKLDEELVQKALRVAQVGGDPPEGLEKPVAKAFASVVAQAKKDFAEAAEIKEKIQQERAEAEAALAQDREKMQEARKEAEGSSEQVAFPLSNLVESSIKTALGDNFVINKDGSFALAKDADKHEAFASAFTGLQRLVNTSDDIKEGFAKAEARLAILAEKEFGNEWPNFFPSSDEKDVARIKKNMKAIKEFTRLKGDPGEIPIGTIRKLTEVRYDKDDSEKNDEIKKDVINEFLKQSKKKGKPLNQIEAQQIVSQATPEKQANAVQKWNYLYVLSDSGSVVGSMDWQPDVAKISTAVIDAKQRLVVTDDEGNQSYETIPSYAGKAVADKADAKAAKKAAKKEATGAVAAPAAKSTAEEVKKEEEEGGDEDSLSSLFEDEE